MRSSRLLKHRLVPVRVHATLIVMKLDVVMLPKDLTPDHLMDRAVVVFDVLRATTTMLTEQILEFNTSDGKMAARVIRPVGSGPHPVVILCVEASGPEMGGLSIARGFAAAGYYVMVRALDEAQAECDVSSSPLRALCLRRVARETETMVRHLDGDAAAMATEIPQIHSNSKLPVMHRRLDHGGSPS